MLKVKALTGFEHNGRVKRGDELTVSETVGNQLARANLVQIIGTDAVSPVPSEAGGGKPSASPPARRSKRTTAKPSDDGEGQDQDEA